MNILHICVADWTTVVFFVFFSVRLLSVLRGHSFFSSPPQLPMTWLPRIFYPRFYPLHLFSYLNFWERASIECSVLNKGTTGTIFITSLVWRGPWTRDLPHLKPALYHLAIEEAVNHCSEKPRLNLTQVVIQYKLLLYDDACF